MRLVAYTLIIIAALAVAASLYVRLAPIDPAQWHVDPETVTPRATPNFALIAGDQAIGIEAQVEDVAARLQTIADAEGAQVIAGSLAEGFVTMVVRTRLMGYPDLVSIKLAQESGVTRMHIFSRSRYGASDLGVNTARVQRWLTTARGV